LTAVKEELSVEREISGGAMLGIVLLALAAVIGLGFGVFAIAKGIANEGTVNVQDSLGTVSDQVFLDYDQKIVTGTQALSGLKTFEGKPYAVLIATKALQGTGGAVAPTHKVYPMAVTTTKGPLSPAFINYNAVLASSGAGALPVTQSTAGGTVTTTNALITLVNGSYEIANGFAQSAGVIAFDKETGGLFKSGNAEFVKTSSKYQANLIKDKSGNIVGIALEQQ
jgi:hypothetical protein